MKLELTHPLSVSTASTLTTECVCQHVLQSLEASIIRTI